MLILKHLKTLQHVSIINQIIFREFVCSLLKLLILKFVKNVKSKKTCFDHHSDHLQGARMFLVKVTDFKIC